MAFDWMDSTSPWSSQAIVGSSTGSSDLTRCTIGSRSPADWFCCSSNSEDRWARPETDLRGTAIALFGFFPCYIPIRSTTTTTTPSSWRTHPAKPGTLEFLSPVLPLENVLKKRKWMQLCKPDPAFCHLDKDRCARCVRNGFVKLKRLCFVGWRNCLWRHILIFLLLSHFS